MAEEKQVKNVIMETKLGALTAKLMMDILATKISSNIQFVTETLTVEIKFGS